MTQRRGPGYQKETRSSGAVGGGGAAGLPQQGLDSVTCGLLALSSHLGAHYPCRLLVHQGWDGKGSKGELDQTAISLSKTISTGGSGDAKALEALLLDSFGNFYASLTHPGGTGPQTWS